MKLSPVVAAPLAAAALTVWLPCPATAQNAPKLTKSQRTALETVVAAVDKAAAGGTDAATTAATWQDHVLRASSGAHYVAVHAVVPGVPPPADAVVLYVRLMTRRGLDTTLTAERSAVMEWLKGLRGDPLPRGAGRPMSVPQGELPIGGAAVLAARNGDTSIDSSNLLRLQERERERAAREKAEREKQRRAELESAALAPAAVMHPFEDFDVQARLGADRDGVVIDRGFTAGPGQYDLYVGWSESAAGNKPPQVRLLTHRITLPGASATDFALSDVVVADSVRKLPAPYPVDQQGAHPYAVGSLEAVPARDLSFRVDEDLAVVFQVINPAGAIAGAGPPDVEVGFRVTRLGERDTLIGTLPAQRYSRDTLPADFDVAKGHPVFAAVQAPLRSFARGRYRLAITAVDRVSGRQTGRDVLFDVTGTPESLLREAPAPGQAFRRDAILSPAMLAALARGLTPQAPSTALTAALAQLAAGRFAELVQADLTAVHERPIGLALRGLALYGLGDSPRAVAAQLQQAAAQGAPAAAVQLVLGATAALNGDDRTAVAVWDQAREGGIDDAAVGTLLVDAYMRQGDLARAGAMARAALDSQPGNAAAARVLAATYIATGRYTEALGLLDGAAAGSDADTTFLVLHALYAGHVRAQAPGNTPAGHERFITAARAYTAAGARHADLVLAWLAAVDESAAR